MSIQFGEQNNVKETGNIHTNKNWIKHKILTFESGKFILWKWCFVGNLKEVEFLHEFRMVDG